MAYFVFLPTDLLPEVTDFLHQYSKKSNYSQSNAIGKMSCRVLGNALKYSTVQMQIYAQDFTGVALSELMYI